MSNLTQQQKILIGVGAGVVVIGLLAAVYFLFLRKPAQPTATAPMPGQTASAPPAPGGPMGAMTAGQQPGAGFTPPGGAAPAGQQPPGRPGSGASLLASRPDPFKPFPLPREELERLKREKARLEQLLREMNRPVYPPVTIQAGGIRPGPTLGGPVPASTTSRRVAGILWDDRVWALVESGGETFVVKPGDEFDGYKVQSILRDAIVLTDPSGRRILIPVTSKGPSLASESISGPVSVEAGGLPLAPPESEENQPTENGQYGQPPTEAPESDSSGAYEEELPGLPELPTY